MKCTITLLALLLSGLTPARADEPLASKLQYMYRLFYLPFPLEFVAGRDVDTVLPYRLDAKGKPGKMLEAHQLVALDTKWNSIRNEWKRKSLLEFTKVPEGKSTRITQRLVSHHVSLTKPVIEPTRFLQSFLSPEDTKRFNFFLISASWCESSREYRNLLEGYFKRFPDPELTLHSVVVEDPKNAIFDSRFMKELFPNPKRYTHDTVPRFLAYAVVNGKPKVWEEGEALKELYERYYIKHRGFLGSAY